MGRNYSRNTGASALSFEKSGLSPLSKQKPKRKSRKQTTDKEKLENLYKKVEKSIFTGQGNLLKYISDAKALGRARGVQHAQIIKVVLTTYIPSHYKDELS